MAKKTEQPKEETQTEITPPDGAERFTVVIDSADRFPLHSIVTTSKGNYRVVSLLTHEDGVAVEFVRVQ